MRCTLRGAVALVVGQALVGAPDAHALDPRTEASEYIRRVWGTAQGLPQSSVAALAQTPDGYLWVGTHAGLARFDGVAFKPFAPADTPEGAPVNFAERAVGALVVDHSGALWIGTAGSGVARWKEGRLLHVSLADGAPLNLAALAETTDGTIWAGGWYAPLVRLEGRRFVRAFPSGFPDPSIVSLAADREGNLWVGTSGPLVRVRAGRAEPFPLAGSEHFVRALTVDHAGVIWAGGVGGLHRIEGERARRMVEGGLDGLRDIVALREDRHANLWIGTRDGAVRRWDGKRLSTWRDAPATGTVLALSEDREGSLWIGVLGEGLVQLKDGSLVRIVGPAGVARPTALIADAPDGWWVGTAGTGLAHLGPGGLRFFGRAQGLPDEVWSLARSADGGLWIGGDRNGVLLRHPPARGGGVATAGITFARETLGPDKLTAGVRALAPDANGGLWIGTAGDGLLHMRGDRTTRLGARDGLDGDTVHALHYDSRGRLWIGQMRDLLWIENERIAGRYRHPAGAYFTSFLEDAAGDLWIATGIGLVRHRRGTFTHYGGAQGLHAEALLGLVEDGHGYLWFCSRRGIFRVRKQEFDDVDAGRLARVASLGYGAIEGLNAVACSDGYAPRAARGRDGRLWFSTVGGLISVDPDRSAPPVPPVLVDSLVVDGAAVAVGAAAELAPGTRRVQILYTAPTFLAPDSVVFRYRLEGFDSGWVLAGGSRRAEYTNLPPGRYRFRVAASSGDGVWRDAASALALHMKPHFWQTWLFVVACAMGAIGIAAAAYRARVQRLEDRVHAVLAERNRLSRELHDTLSARLNGVRLQLDAAARQLAHDPEQARRALDEARAELPQSLAETRRAIWMLRDGHRGDQDLKAALEDCARQVTAGTDTRAEVAVRGERRPLPPETTEHLVRIAQEALSNAVRHGRARNVDLDVEFAGRGVTMTISDDGRGLDAAPAPGATTDPVTPTAKTAPVPAGTPPDGHYGLAVMRERARLIGGDLDVSARADGGVRVAVSVPRNVLLSLWRSFSASSFSRTMRGRR